MPISAPTPSLPVPTQNRSRAQLQEGLRVGIQLLPPPGGGPFAANLPNALPHHPELLPVARVAQDAAEFVASRSGRQAVVPPNVATRLDDPSAPGQVFSGGEAGALGANPSAPIYLHPFIFHQLHRGIERLRTTPFGEWSFDDQWWFVAANTTLLHEQGHRTGPKTSAETEVQLEEPLTEVVAQQDIVPFVRQEYGVDVPAPVIRALQERNGYAPQVARLNAVLEAAVPSPKERERFARYLADVAPYDQRTALLDDRLRAAGLVKLGASVDDSRRHIETFIEAGSEVAGELIGVTELRQS